jgi:ABC-2 type transport system ATP-binding protein
VTAALEVHGLVKRFGTITAVDGLDLVVPAGTLVALLGPNGAGKTTTIEICEGFQRPDQGTVRVLGLDPFRNASTLRPRVGVMLQGSGAHLSARTGEMLRLVAACSSAPHNPDWLLDLLGLTAVAQTPVRRLSGGQAQRLNLAMALVGRPELLFLDEPTAGLDPQARHLVWDLLTAARADGVSILLTTHLLDEAERLADHVVIVDHGRVVRSGSVADLTDDDDSLHFTAVAGLDLSRLQRALPGGLVVTEARPGAYRVKGPVTPGTIATVTAWCAQAGVLAGELRVGRRGLEDVYLEVTGRQVRS